MNLVCGEQLCIRPLAIQYHLYFGPRFSQVVTSLHSLQPHYCKTFLNPWLKKGFNMISVFSRIFGYILHSGKLQFTSGFKSLKTHSLSNSKLKCWVYFVFHLICPNSTFHQFQDRSVFPSLLSRTMNYGSHNKHKAHRFLAYVCYNSVFVFCNSYHL